MEKYIILQNHKHWTSILPCTKAKKLTSTHRMLTEFLRFFSLKTRGFFEKELKAATCINKDWFQCEAHNRFALVNYTDVLANKSVLKILTRFGSVHIQHKSKRLRFCENRVILRLKENLYVRYICENSACTAFEPIQSCSVTDVTESFDLENPETRTVERVHYI